MEPIAVACACILVGILRAAEDLLFALDPTAFYSLLLSSLSPPNPGCPIFTAASSRLRWAFAHANRSPKPATQVFDSLAPIPYLPPKLRVPHTYRKPHRRMCGTKHLGLWA